ncbi:MAG TPA: tetratricopeptide repeat protein [Burkholderiaceae bacterium]|nr:tetratricopeptide repeat protein [Burkholderiaceae bacterium]HQR70664.1 tetratricopeptide repeat protein [Burkholderiaceae bacterium]
MVRLSAIALTTTLLAAGSAAAQGAPSLETNVGQIPQTAPGAPWSFIGFAITSPADSQWFVTTSTPRGGTMGRSMSTTEPHSAVLVVSSELLERPVESDNELLAIARQRHARIGERWVLSQHDETLTRHAGTRCARHVMEAREPEDKSPRRDAAQANAVRSYLHVTGLSCVHPTEPRLLVEIGISERSPRDAMSPIIRRDAEQVPASLAFQRYSEAALQKSAEFARVGNVADAEAMLKPYIDADAAWARYFLAQIVERSVPPPKDLGARLRSLLEPAAERGLADAQWMLGSLYLRGAPELPRDTARAEALLRRAAERGNPGAAFQLGIVLLSGADAVTPNQREALLWITRSAARGQKEAQDLLEGLRPGAPVRSEPAGPVTR